MLTCLIGDTLINCFDGKYDKYTLKQYSDKNILKCPVCNGTYEYCHGEFISPYFRHKEKECKGYHSEPETEEHRLGKIALYNWIKAQENVTNYKLEAWIPETKQRPDIYFEYNGKKFVIEFQCTPIASEYIERRRLYKLNNITDIWILGIDKYKLKPQFINNNGVILRRDGRERVIEKDQSHVELLYFNVEKSLLMVHKYFMNRFFNRPRYREGYYAFSINDFNFEKDSINLINEKFKMKLIDEYNKYHKKEELNV